MPDGYLEKGSRSVRPFSCTWLTRYRPGFFADATASDSVGNARFPSLHVREISQNVASLKYPIFVLLAFVVCMIGLDCGDTGNKQKIAE